MLVEVWSACVGAVLTNTTAGRRLAATQNIGNVQLDIVTYERFRSLAAAQASVVAFQTDLKRCVAAVSVGNSANFPVLIFTHPPLGSGKFAAAVVAGIPKPYAKAMFKPHVPANPKPSW